MTADGSASLQIPEWQEQYHSLHGALQESRHVFIEKGLASFSNREIDLLEIGFGTGLNALLTYLKAPQLELKVNYSGLEAFPVVQAEWEALNYGQLFPDTDAADIYSILQLAHWEKSVRIGEHFTLCKRNQDFCNFSDIDNYDLIYYDAFGARVQPELWTGFMFDKMFRSLKSGGCLVTYAAKGSVRRAMLAVGFRVERLQGPPGKREMLRAWKD